MSADSDAFDVVSQIPNLTDAERQYLLTVARGEGFYGLGWANPNAQTIALSERFGIDPRAGAGSNNWGAVQGTGSAGSFPHVDHGWRNPDGTPWNRIGPKVWLPYVAQYKKHATPLEGALSTAKVLLKPNVKAAANSGDLSKAVEAQKANGYFELSAVDYFKAAKRNYDALTTNLKWPKLLEPGELSVPLVSAGPQSSGLPDSSSGEPSSLNGNEPEGGFVRGQKYSVPGIQDK